METISRPITAVDFTSLQPDGSFWRTQNHFLRMVPSATATNLRFKNTLSAYQSAGLPIDVIQAPNHLWYTVEPCGAVALPKLYLGLDYELRLYVWLSLARTLSQYHHAQLSYGRCQNPQITLGLNGQVFLHGCQLEKNISRSEEVKLFSRFLSRLITQPCDAISLKQQNQLAASSLMVALNEGCAGNLKSYNGVKTLLRSIELLLPSTADVLQRRLAHALSNEALKSVSNRLSIQLEQQIRQRKYPKGSTNVARPTPKSIENQSETAPISIPSKQLHTQKVKKHFLDTVEIDLPQTSIEEEAPSSPRTNRLDTPSSSKTPEQIAKTELTAVSEPVKIQFFEPKPLESPSYSNRQIIIACGLSLAILSAVMLWPEPLDTSVRNQSMSMPSKASKAPIQSPELNEQEYSKDSPSEADLPQSQIGQNSQETISTSGVQNSRKRQPKYAKQRKRRQRQIDTLKPNAQSITKPQTPPILPVDSQSLDIDTNRQQTSFDFVKKSKESSFKTIKESVWQTKALKGLLTSEDIVYLRSAPSSDPFFTVSQTLILMHAQVNDEKLLMKMALDSLMSIKDNQTNPYLLLSSAHYAINEKMFAEAIQRLNAVKGPNWPEQNTQFVGQWYELYANAITGLIYVQGNQSSLDEVIEAWDRAFAYAQYHQQNERLSRIQATLSAIEGSNQ